MTLNKSLISVAAATILAAGFAGCGSSSSTTTTTTTQPTSIGAVDGYVLNYAVSATYSDGNTSAKNYSTVALTDAVTYASVAAGGATTKGSSTLNLSELNASVLDNLQYVTLSFKAETSDGTTKTFGTFFDANGDNLFSAADGDQLATSAFSLKIPAAYNYITPLTSLIQARYDVVTAADTNDTNKSEVMALVLSEISDALFISEDSLKNIDPMDAVSNDPGFTFINAALGQAVTDGDLANIAASLSTATAATDLVSGLRNIAAGATKSASFYTSAADQFESDPSMINSIASMNLDASRTNTATAATTFTPIMLSAGSADFNVTSIKIGTKDTDTLLGSGAKVSFATTSLDATVIGLNASTDANVTNKAITLAISIGSQETRVNADANISSLTILVPMEINNTVDATQYMNVAVSDTVTWEGVLPSGATFSGDMNSSVFTNVAGASDEDYGIDTPVSIAANTGGSAVMNLKIAAILRAIDANSTEENILTDATVISDLKIALVDNNSTMQKIDSNANTVYWGNTAIASVRGGINVTGKSIFKNTTTDARASTATTGANVAAKTTVTLTSGTATTTNINGYATTKVTGAGLGNSTYVINEGDASHFDIASLYTNTDTGEKNTTVAFTKSTNTLDGNTSATVVDVNATAVSNFSAKVSNSSTTETPSQTELIKLSSSAARPLGSSAVAGGGYSMATYNVISTDEFSKASVAADSNITFVYNARPTVDVNSSWTNSLVTLKMVSNATGSTNPSNATVGSTTVEPSSYATTLTGVVSVNDESNINALTNNSAGWTILGLGVGNTSALASANMSTTTASVTHNYNATTNLRVTLTNGLNNATGILFEADNTTAYAGFASLSLTNASNAPVFTFNGNASGNASALTNMSTGTTVAVRLNVVDEYDANTTKDLYIKFTK